MNSQWAVAFGNFIDHDDGLFAQSSTAGDLMLLVDKMNDFATANNADGHTITGLAATEARLIMEAFKAGHVDIQILDRDKKPFDELEKSELEQFAVELETRIHEAKPMTYDDENKKEFVVPGIDSDTPMSKILNALLGCYKAILEAVNTRPHLAAEVIEGSAAIKNLGIYFTGENVYGANRKGMPEQWRDKAVEALELVADQLGARQHAIGKYKDFFRNLLQTGIVSAKDAHEQHALLMRHAPETPR